MIAAQRVVVLCYNDAGYRLGETHQNAHISDATVDHIRELHEDRGLSYKEIARKLRLALTTVRKICCYQRRAQTPARFKRLAELPFALTPAWTVPAHQPLCRRWIRKRKAFVRWTSPWFTWNQGKLAYD